LVLADVETAISGRIKELEQNLGNVLTWSPRARQERVTGPAKEILPSEDRAI
jgi:hypothetical protein